MTRHRREVLEQNGFDFISFSDQNLSLKATPTISAMTMATCREKMRRY
ncbi:hypothetical protein K3G39_18950 [Pontibacter sp. HSC-14F20]|nr:hypothetical protein [Pontibacter sp. HSC-14F20]